MMENNESDIKQPIPSDVSKIEGKESQVVVCFSELTSDSYFSVTEISVKPTSSKSPSKHYR